MRLPLAAMLLHIAQTWTTSAW